MSYDDPNLTGSLTWTVTAPPQPTKVWHIYSEAGPVEVDLMAIATEIDSRTAPLRGGYVTRAASGRFPEAKIYVYANHDALEQGIRDLEYTPTWLLVAADLEDGSWLHLGDNVFWSRETAQAAWDAAEAKPTA